MGYDIRFDVRQQGAETINQIDQLMQRVKSSTSATSAELKTFEAIVRAEVAAGNSLAEALKNISSASNGVPPNLRNIAQSAQTATAAITELSVATKTLGTRGVSDVTAIGGALRDLTGSGGVRTIATFTSSILGLGDAFQSAFALTAVVAAGEMLYRFLEKIDPLNKAEKELAATTKTVDAEFARLADHIEALKVEQLTAEFGKIKGMELKGFFAEGALGREAVEAANLAKEIKGVTSELAPYLQAKAIAGAAGMGPLYSVAGSIPGIGVERKRAALETKLAELQAKQDIANETATEKAQEVRTDKAREDKDAADEARRRSREAAAAAKEALSRFDEEGLAHLKASHELSIGEIIQYWEKRRTVEFSNVDREREIMDKLGTLYQERDKMFDRIAKRGQEVEKTAAQKAEKQLSFLEAMADEATKLADEAGAKSVEAATKLADLKSKGEEAGIAGGFTKRRLEIQRGAGLNSGEGSQSIAATVSEYQQLKKLEQEEGTARIATETDILTRLQALGKGHEDEVQTQENHIAEIRMQAKQKEYADETKLLETVHAEQIKELNSFKGEVGGVFDAITSRQPNALANLFKSQALGIGRTITENAAAQYIYPELKKIPHASDPNSGLGKILQGTPLGADPLKASASALDLSAEKLSGAADALVGAARGGTGGAGSAPGTIGSGATPSFPGFGSGTVAGPSGNSGTLFGISTGTIMGVAAAGAGAFAAYQGFKSGGVGGVSQGVGAIAGTAAMFDPEPISKAILAVTAIALPLIGGLFGGPQRRENEITKDLAMGQYMAPTALNLTQDSSGHYTDFDARGGIRSSTFSPYPETTNPFIFSQTHGIFGGPPTFYNVPGGTQQPYSPAPVIVNHNYSSGAIQTIDAGSFNDLVQRNSSGVSDAVASGLQNAHSRLTDAVQYVTNTGRHS